MLSLWRVERGEGRLPAGGRRLPSFCLLYLARRRRKKGAYDIRTLALFRAVWLRRKTPAALMDYALFRRDMGYPLPKGWVDPLLRGIRELSPSRRPLALALVGESAPLRLLEIPGEELQAGRRMAPIAAICLRRGMAAPGWLASLHERQEEWRQNFAALLDRSREEGICVVGNAGSLSGGGQGHCIDSHGLVVRFNRFRSDSSSSADIGSRVDIWCGAPGFPSPPPDGVDWVIISGPDMRFRRQDWAPLQERLEKGIPVLTVPLGIWRKLVASLQAPPSAGLLLLAWIKELLGGWEGISIIGIGGAPSSKASYHHADHRQKAVERHNWPAERALLQKWYAEGLHQNTESDDDTCHPTILGAKNA